MIKSSHRPPKLSQNYPSVHTTYIVYNIRFSILWFFTISNNISFVKLSQMATYLVQTKDLVQTRANLLNKFQKILKKIMNVFLRLRHLYIKFHGQIRLTLEVTKKTNLRCIWTIIVVRKFIFFVTSRVRRIWPWNFIYIWGKLRSTFMIFFRIFWNFFQ